MKSPRELVAQQELMADEIVKFVTEGRADEAIRRFPEHEPEIRALESLHRSSKDRNPQTNLQGATGYRSLQGGHAVSRVGPSDAAFPTTD